MTKTKHQSQSITNFYYAYENLASYLDCEHH